MPLEPHERDELLVRVDERTQLIIRTITDMSRHLEKQNSHLEETYLMASGNRTWRKINTWVIGIIATALGTLYSKLMGLW